MTGDLDSRPTDTAVVREAAPGHSGGWRLAALLAGLALVGLSVSYGLMLTFIVSRPGPHVVADIVGFITGLVFALGCTCTKWALTHQHLSPRAGALMAVVPALVLGLNVIPGGDGLDIG